MEAARRILSAAGPEGLRWFAQLAAAGPPVVATALPPDADLPLTLLDLAVPHEDVDALCRLRPHLEASNGLRWILERCAARLVGAMGEVLDTGFEACPPLPEDLGPLHRCFSLYVFLAAFPHVQAYHRSRGIPDAVSRHTLADLGRHMAVHRWRSGQMGLGRSWLPLHFRGLLYQLGRLQFERVRADAALVAACRSAGILCGPADPVLAIHIPEWSGPLAAPACRASLEAAAGFFAGHFPEAPVRVATCDSWLLDPQLADYLPAEANIVRFQRRFRPVESREDDRSIMTFVFGRQYADPAEVPRRTALERAIGDHLRAGRHWRGVRGWLAL
jgi:hypothetical protein